jgi:hypothetical protein
MRRGASKLAVSRRPSHQHTTPHHATPHAPPRAAPHHAAPRTPHHAAPHLHTAPRHTTPHHATPHPTTPHHARRTTPHRTTPHTTPHRTSRHTAPRRATPHHATPHLTTAGVEAHTCAPSKGEGSNPPAPPEAAGDARAGPCCKTQTPARPTTRQPTSRQPTTRQPTTRHDPIPALPATGLAEMDLKAKSIWITTRQNNRIYNQATTRTTRNNAPILSRERHHERHHDHNRGHAPSRLQCWYDHTPPPHPVAPSRG